MTPMLNNTPTEKARNLISCAETMKDLRCLQSAHEKVNMVMDAVACIVGIAPAEGPAPAPDAGDLATLLEMLQAGSVKAAIEQLREHFDKDKFLIDGYVKAVQSQGKLTMLDALNYIHNDPRFYARPKDSNAFAIQWHEQGTWIMHFDVDKESYQGSPHMFKPSTLFAEWEIVRPEQVVSNLKVTEVKADV